jgi:iron complex outermembrane recepter protein
MRGLSGANNVLVLVDGRKLNNPSLAAPALNTIALKDVERIEIVQGSAGVLYGDQAVGGVINVITRRAIAGEAHGSISVLNGTDNLEDYSASVNQGFANGLSYNLSAQKRNADNYRDNNQSAYENALGNLRYDFARGFVFVEAQSVNDELRTPGSISAEQVEQNPRQTNSPDNYSNQYTDTLRLGGGYTFSDAWALNAEYSDRDETGDYVYAPNLTHYSMRVKSFTPRLIGNFASAYGKSIVTLGYDAIDSDYRSNNLWSPIASTQKQQAIYAQLVYPLSSQLTATLGSRYAEVEDDNSLYALGQDDHLQASEAGLSYQLDASWRIFGRYAESFRFANVDENNLVPVGTLFLAPQTGDSWELGAAWSGAASTLSYSLYQMDLSDQIVFDGIQYANINLPKSERQGAMLDANLVLSEQIALHLNYTYTQAEVAVGEFRGKEVPFVASNTAVLGLVFTPVQNLSLVVDGIYTGSRYQADDQANSAGRLAPLTVFNASLLYSIDALEFGVRVKNITNERYAGFHSVWGQYPQPERNYEASITYSF